MIFRPYQSGIREIYWPACQTAQTSIEGNVGLNRRAEWRNVLDYEVRRWLAMPDGQLVAALRNQQVWK